MPPEYRKAIEACVRGDFLDYVKRWDDSNIQKAFFQNVITPLETELKGWGISPETLHLSLYEVPAPRQPRWEEVSLAFRTSILSLSINLPASF